MATDVSYRPSSGFEQTNERLLDVSTCTPWTCCSTPWQMLGPGRHNCCCSTRLPRPWIRRSCTLPGTGDITRRQLSGLRRDGRVQPGRECGSGVAELRRSRYSDTTWGIVVQKILSRRSKKLSIFSSVGDGVPLSYHPRDVLQRCQPSAVMSTRLWMVATVSAPVDVQKNFQLWYVRVSQMHSYLIDIRRYCATIPSPSRGTSSTCFYCSVRRI